MNSSGLTEDPLSYYCISMDNSSVSEHNGDKKGFLHFVTSASHKRTFMLLGMLLIILVIPLTVIIAQRQQEIRQHAAGGTCRNDADCSTTETCVASVCQTISTTPQCTSDSNCAAGQVCDTTTSTCVASPTSTAAPTATPTSSVGGVCSQNSDCSAGLSCVSQRCEPSSTSVSATPTQPTTFVGGSCTNNSDCTSPNVCVFGSCTALDCSVEAGGVGLASNCVTSCGAGYTSCGPCSHWQQTYIQGQCATNPGNTGCSDLLTSMTTNSCTVPGGACASGQTKPFFSCVNNSCTAQNSCGTNSGGCTAAGQSCGSPTNVQLSLTLALQGVGFTGSSTQPTLTTLHTPKNTTRSVTVSVFDQNNNPVKTANGSVQFNTTSGLFTGTIDIPGLPAGQYIVKVTTQRYLVKKIPGIQTLAIGTNAMPQVTMIAGDVNMDNKLSIEDYSILSDCYGAGLTSGACTTDKQNPKVQPDINDDGVVDGLDYQLFFDSLSIQQGD